MGGQDFVEPSVTLLVARAPCVLLQRPRPYTYILLQRRLESRPLALEAKNELVAVVSAL